MGQDLAHRARHPQFLQDELPYEVSKLHKGGTVLLVLRMVAVGHLCPTVLCRDVELAPQMHGQRVVRDREVVAHHQHHLKQE